jgi:hypothetical protein
VRFRDRSFGADTIWRAISKNDKRTDGPMPQPALFGQAAGNRIAVTG